MYLQTIDEFIEDSKKYGFEIIIRGEKYYCITTCNVCHKVKEKEIKIQLNKFDEVVSSNLWIYCDECTRNRDAIIKNKKSE